MEQITTIILTFLLASTPLSLITIKLSNKIFYKKTKSLKENTAICTNVTGTLTNNVFQVKTLIFDNFQAKFLLKTNLLKLKKLHQIENEKEEELNQNPQNLKDNQTIKLMATATCFCTYPKVNEFEKIINNFWGKCGFNQKNFLQEYEIISTLPTNPTKKFSTIIIRNKQNKEIFAFYKGHAKKIIEKCNRIEIEGKKSEITYQLKRKLRKKMAQINKNGEKVIAFAYRPLPKKLLDKYTENFTEKEMIFLGMVGISDSINTNLLPIIEKLKKLGIKTYITTEIEERRAISTARKLGVINPQYFESFTGPMISQLKSTKLKTLLSNKEKDFIFAELNPGNQKQIIQTLKELGKNIIFTKQKNNETLEIILKNIQKKLQYEQAYPKLKFHSLSSKITQLFLLLTALILNAPLPLTIFLILIIEVIVNIPLQCSFTKEIHNKKLNFSKKYFLKNGIINGILISFIYFWSLIRFGWEPKTNWLNLETWNFLEKTATQTLSNQGLLKSITITFLFIIFIQIFNIYSLKNEKKSIFKINIFKNYYLILTTIIIFLISYILIYFPEINTYLSLTKPIFAEWLILIFMFIIVLIIDELRKKLISKSNENISK